MIDLMQEGARVRAALGITPEEPSGETALPIREAVKIQGQPQLGSCAKKTTSPADDAYPPWSRHESWAQQDGNIEKYKGHVAFADNVQAESVLEGAPTTPHQWMNWIAVRCPVLPDDRRHIMHSLQTLPPSSLDRVAHRYVSTWREAAEAEPLPHRQDNAGRRAANLTLLVIYHGRRGP